MRDDEINIGSGNDNFFGFSYFLYLYEFVLAIRGHDGLCGKSSLPTISWWLMMVTGMGDRSENFVAVMEWEGFVG